ncbi:hypothetical protein K7W42_09850 [Deinococcus sp. HMF7604]|uniref:hypothetical protein n=1 Tax=Deinococcus betulae TaxID=2873312 RepID=UPI001CD008C0|nr:hypothetical protein [Deinococcus betulae]MBZ9751166.1 hypothetical protein [Deinococcus betulae]
MDWQAEPTDPDFHVLLFREYLRRASWFAVLARPPHWPFFNVAGIILPTLGSPASHLDFVQSLAVSPLIQRLALWMLQFALVKDILGKRWLVPAFCDEPYEPLLMLLESGGVLSQEHGFVDVTYRGLFLRPPREALGFIPHT